MRRISRKATQSFEKWGKMGGKTRARCLSSRERSAIAAHAARARWKKHVSLFLPSVRLENAQLEDPVYLEEVLSDGTWEDWRRLYQTIADRPFGRTAAALEKTCSFAKIYGVTTLWLSILRIVQGGVT